jgi:O-antigen/teichoic acid export membrane protein
MGTPFFSTLTNRIRALILRILPKGSAAHSISLIAGGTAMAQLLGILTMPVFSRIYSPVDFGVLALFSSITGILMEVSGLRYHFAIPLPKKESFARSLVVLSLALQCLFIALLTIALFFAKDFLLELVSAELLKPYWFLIPLGVGGMGLYLILTQWAVREAEFSLIAKTKVTQSISGILVKLLFGLLGIKPLGLLLGNIASQAGGITTLGKKLISKNGFPKANKEQLKRVAIKYRKFPLYSTWGGMLNTLGRQITPIMLIAFYGAETAGFFALGMRILQLPVTFIGQAIGQVFVQRASRAKYEGNLAQVSLKTFEALLQIGTFPILCISLLAPELFSFVFGERWRMAGVFAQFLGPWVVLAFAYSPLTRLFSILNKQDIALLFEISFVMSRIAVLYMGSHFGEASLTIGLFGGVSFLFLSGGILWLLYASGNVVSQVISSILKQTGNALGLLLPVVIALWLNVPFPLSFGIACLSGLLFLKISHKKLRELQKTDDRETSK